MVEHFFGLHRGHLSEEKPVMETVTIYTQRGNLGPDATDEDEDTYESNLAALVAKTFRVNVNVENGDRNLCHRDDIVAFIRDIETSDEWVGLAFPGCDHDGCGAPGMTCGFCGGITCDAHAAAGYSCCDG